MASTSCRLRAQELRIISSVMSVVGTGTSLSVSATLDVVVMVAVRPDLMLSIMSMKRCGSLAVVL